METKVKSTAIPGVTIVVKRAAGPTCPRCRLHDVNIGQPGHHPELCDRCAKVLSE